MQTNEFHGNAVFSGGGFMPSQATQTVPDRPSSSYKSDARCSMPLTVKQLKDLSRVGESGISIDGVDVNNIVLVGMVSKIDNAVSDCTFRVDIYMLCRIHEQSLSFGVAFRPVTDFNEIAKHFIEGIYVHLYNTNLRVRVEALGGMTTQPEVANSNFGNPTKSYGYQTNLTNQIRGVSSKVLQYLRRLACLYVFNASETGVPSDVVARELNKSLQFLVSEGLVYTTIDDHYKFTDA
ncbi:hypothetical protein ES319_D07G235900v1 [Gossypium barbadense]|uniref:Replication protein A C-terminal domain-containing protein n=1 Tax=Gossypium barbadense TaxID=3634 RepID=A0A5J5QV33_GOSBA|nr:hypothetical protein ES319_D07G235900v1 [Gossypium barbadense]